MIPRALHRKIHIKRVLYTYMDYSQKAANSDLLDFIISEGYDDEPLIADSEPFQLTYSTVVSTLSSPPSQISPIHNGVNPSFSMQQSANTIQKLQVKREEPRIMQENFQKHQDLNAQAAMNRRHSVQLNTEDGVGLSAPHLQTTSTRRTLVYHNYSQPTTEISAHSQQLNQLTGPMNKREKISNINDGFAENYTEDTYKASNMYMDYSQEAANSDLLDFLISEGYDDERLIVGSEPFQLTYSTPVSTLSSPPSQISPTDNGVNPSFLMQSRKTIQELEVTRIEPRKMQRNFQEYQDSNTQAAMNGRHCVPLNPQDGVGRNVPHPQTTNTRRTLAYHNSSQATTEISGHSQQINRLTGPKNKRQKISNINGGFADYVPIEQAQSQQTSEPTPLPQLPSQVNWVSSKALNSERIVNLEMPGMLRNEKSGCNINYKDDEFSNGFNNGVPSQPYQVDLRYVWPPSMVLPRRRKWSINNDAKNTIRRS